MEAKSFTHALSMAVQASLGAPLLSRATTIITMTGVIAIQIALNLLQLLVCARGAQRVEKFGPAVVGRGDIFFSFNELLYRNETYLL